MDPFLLYTLDFSVIALTQVVGRQEGHPACQNPGTIPRSSYLGSCGEICWL